MSDKNYSGYINNVKSQINSIETSVTEAHYLGDDSNRPQLKKIMTELESIKNTLNEIQ